MGRPARGFSLIELMIVVGMIGIVAALTVPSVSATVQRQREQGEFGRVVAAVERARNRARVSVCKTLVDVDTTNMRITIKSDPADTDTSCVNLASETLQFQKALVTLSQFDVNAVVTNPLVITASGALVGPNKAILTVTSPVVSGRASRIEVWPAVGAVRSFL